MEEGTFADAGSSGPGASIGRQASWKAIKFAIPSLVMFAYGMVGLPWKEHWGRCGIVLAAGGLVFFWGFRRHQRLLSFQFQPPIPSSKFQAFWRHPLIFFPAILFGTALVAGVLGFVLPIFLNPALVTSRIPYGLWLRSLGVILLVVVLVYALLAIAFLAKGKLLAGTGAISEGFEFLTQAVRPEAVVEKTHGPLFEQLNLTTEQRGRLKDLVLKSTRAEVTNSLSLMNRTLDPARRAALVAEYESGLEECQAQIQQLLGEENYQAFRRYEKTIPDRTMISQFSRKSRRTGIALRTEQEEQLLEALSQARAQHPWTTELGRRNRLGGDYAVMFSQASLYCFAQERAQRRRSDTGC